MKITSLNALGQGRPTRGPRAIFGPPRLFEWPAKTFWMARQRFLKMLKKMMDLQGCFHYKNGLFWAFVRRTTSLHLIPRYEPPPSLSGLPLKTVHFSPQNLFDFTFGPPRLFCLEFGPLAQKVGHPCVRRWENGPEGLQECSEMKEQKG